MGSARVPKLLNSDHQFEQSLMMDHPIRAILGVTFALYLFYRFALWPRYFDPLRNVPVAPGSHWFFGHLKRILKEPTGTPMREWIDTVPNDGLIRYYMWFKQRVLVTNPDALSDLLVTNAYDFIKPSIVRNAIERITGPGLILQEGDVHKANRKALMPAFTFRQTKMLYAVFWSKARQLAQCLGQACVSGSPVEVGLWTSRATVDIIGWGGMGMNFDALGDPDNELAQAYRAALTLPLTGRVALVLQFLGLFLPREYPPIIPAFFSHVANKILIEWLVMRIPCRHNRVMTRSVNLIRANCADVMAKKRQALADEKKEKSDETDVLSIALNSGRFSDEELVTQTMTFMAAGHESSASVINETLYLLARNPEIQSKLRAEIREHIPSIDAEIAPEDVERCNLLQAVCSEVLRIWPPLVHSFRMAVRDTRIRDTIVPKGTSLILSFWAINRSKKLWGEDAEEFKPERWMDENGRATANGGSTSNFANMTFLHGPRSCIGKGFASASFACAIAAIIGSLEVKFEEGSALAKGEEVFIGRVSNKVKGGMWCVLTKVPGWEG